MKGMTVSKRMLSFFLALLMLVSAFPVLALPAFAEGETPEAEQKVWTDEDYAKLYVTDADGDGNSDLIFKWDAFDLEAGATVTELKNQVEGGQNVALDKVFSSSNKLIATDAVSKVSNGTEKDTVLGNPGEADQQIIQNVANSAVDTKGALLTTATLDFSAFLPSHKVGDVTVLDDVTFEMTLFQQNFYEKDFYSYKQSDLDENKDNAYKVSSSLVSAARFGPFSASRFIHDNLTYVKNEYVPAKPYDESYGFIAHSTFSYSNTDGKNNAIVTDVDPSCTSNVNKKLYGNHRLKTFSVGMVFNFAVEENATEGTFRFQYVRNGEFYDSYSTGKYNALYSGHWVGSTNPTAAHNNFWFGGNLPFAYRAIRMYSVALNDAQIAQNHAAELLDYYRVDLTDFNSLSGSALAEVFSALKALRLGETTKEAIEAIIKPIAEKAAEEKIYEDLYVTDADGDGKSDLLFKWDAFDLEAGAAVTVLENQIFGGQSITLGKGFNANDKNNPSMTNDANAVGTVSNGKEKDTVLGDTTAENLVADSTIDTNGAVLTTSLLDFSAIAPSHTVGGVTVLDDITIEMTMFQQNYYGTASVPRSAARFGPFAKSRYIHDRNDSASTTPLSASYGFIAHSTLGYTKADGAYGAWHTDGGRSTTKVFGNDRLQTYTVGVLFDYSVAENETTGTFYFDYFRDAKPTGSGNAAGGKYDARYCGNIASAGAAHNTYWFGGNLPFAYRAIRVYSVALTAEQMAQNHIAELFDYYRADPALYLSLTDKPLTGAQAALAELRLGETTKEEIEALVEECANAYYPPLYSELYVQDGLVFLWSGEGYELGDNKTAFKAFNNLVGEGAINQLTQERLAAGYYKQKDLASYYIVDKGVVSESDCKLYLTNIIPTKEYNGENILSDMTLEVSQSLPLYYKTSLNGAESVSKRNFDTGCIYLGPEGYYNYTKVSSGAIIYGGKYYATYQYTPNGSTESETVYTPVDPSSTKQAFTLYRMVNGVLVEAEDIRNMYLVEKDGSWVMHEEASGTFEPALTTHGHRQTTRNLPAFDAYGNGPIEGWSSHINAYVDNPVKNTARFLNGKPGEVFTSTIRFDYDDAFTKASAISYALSLYRDAANVYNKNSTYDVNADYTTGSNTYSKVFYSDDVYVLNEETGKYEKTAIGMKYGFTYGLSSTMIYHGIRLYNRALEDHEIAQNHFIDLAFAFDANLKDYLALGDEAKARIHTLFAKSTSLDFTKESFEATLADYIAADGFYLTEGFDALLGFEGFGGRLWDKESLRAVFTANISLIEKLEALGAEIEVGVLVAPAEDGIPTVSYDAEGTPTASFGVLRTVYLSDMMNLLKDTDDANLKTFALALVLDDPAFMLELASELTFRAYVTVKNAKTPYVHYTDTDSELFEETISFTELYRFLYMSGYENLPVVKKIGGELAELLDAVKAELDAAKTAQNAALQANEALAKALALYASSRAALPDTVADAYLVLTHAVTAKMAANAIRDTIHDDFTENAEVLTEAIATLEAAVNEQADADIARLLTLHLKKTFDELEKTAALYEKTELTPGANDVQKYMAAFDLIDPDATFPVNGTDVFDYILLPDKNSYYAAKTFALAIYESYGVLPLTVLSGLEDVLLNGETPCIAFTENDNNFGSWSITLDGNDLILSGGGENGAYRAVNELLARIKDGAITLEKNLSSETDETLAVQKFAADKFLNPDGTLDTEGTEPLTVAFLGGSLTELTDIQADAINNWRLQVSNYLESIFPNREFTFYNAGIGGTTSYAGATRFYEHIGQHKPDIVFIEFTVNDQMSGYSELEAQTSMESILYQCAQLETIPSIIYTHNPYATYPDSSLYNSWMKQVLYKEEWAAHYDISTVNVYNLIYREYELAYEEGTANDFISFLDTYYGTKYDTESQYGWYDVHGGYKWYADAIIEALEANGASMLRPFRMGAYLNPAQTNIIEASYNYIFHDSDRFTYHNGTEDGNAANNWTLYTKENQTGMKVYGENNVATRHWEGPEGHVRGLRHISGADGAYFEFTTTASKIVVHDQLSVVGSKNNVIYVVDKDGNETKLGNSSCYHSSSQQPSIQSRPIDLKNPNHDEILIRIRIEDNLTYYRNGSDTKFTTEYNAETHASVTPVYSTFRFGGIIEIFD